MDTVAESSGNKQLACLQCGTPMVFLKREDIQLGKHTYFGGDMGNLLAGSLPVTMYVCPDCGHLELFTSERPPEPGPSGPVPFYTPGTGPEIKCPQCGKLHPSDDDFCPLCGLPRLEPCPHCGTAFPVTEEVCPHCGGRRAEDPQ